MTPQSASVTHDTIELHRAVEEVIFSKRDFFLSEWVPGGMGAPPKNTLQFDTFNGCSRDSDCSFVRVRSFRRGVAGDGRKSGEFTVNASYTASDSATCTGPRKQCPFHRHAAEEALHMDMSYAHVLLPQFETE